MTVRTWSGLLENRMSINKRALVRTALPRGIFDVQGIERYTLRFLGIFVASIRQRVYALYGLTEEQLQILERGRPA
jgi:hypothetical protein